MTSVGIAIAGIIVPPVCLVIGIVWSYWLYLKYRGAVQDVIQTASYPDTLISIPSDSHLSETRRQSIFDPGRGRNHSQTRRTPAEIQISQLEKRSSRLLSLNRKRHLNSRGSSVEIARKSKNQYGVEDSDEDPVLERTESEMMQIRPMSTARRHSTYDHIQGYARPVDLSPHHRSHSWSTVYPGLEEPQNWGTSTSESVAASHRPLLHRPSSQIYMQYPGSSESASPSPLPTSPINTPMGSRKPSLIKNHPSNNSGTTSRKNQNNLFRDVLVTEPTPSHPNPRTSVYASPNYSIQSASTQPGYWSNVVPLPARIIPGNIPSPISEVSTRDPQAAKRKSTLDLDKLESGLSALAGEQGTGALDQNKTAGTSQLQEHLLSELDQNTRTIKPFLLWRQRSASNGTLPSARAAQDLVIANPDTESLRTESRASVNLVFKSPPISKDKTPLAS